MATKHKHCELIHAWADGATIEEFVPFTGEWETNNDPSWYERSEFRIKPVTKLDVAIELLETIAVGSTCYAKDAQEALNKIRSIE